MPVYVCIFYGSVSVEARSPKEAIEKAVAVIKEDPRRVLRLVSERVESFQGEG